MRLLVFVFLVLLLAVGLALLVEHDPGYVLVSYADWTAESTLAVFVVLAAAVFGTLYFLIRFLVGTLALPGALGRWRRGRRSGKARSATNRGLIALAEGHWERAEKELNRAADNSDTPLINYLGAARAAQKRGADSRRDHYLRLAHQSMPEAELAIGLTQAEVQLSQGQLEQALATLMHLRSIAPRHGYVLNLLRKLYERLGSWSDLLTILPDLRRHGVLDSQAADQLERKALGELLHRAARAGRAEALLEAWPQVPKARRGDAELVHIYAEGLLATGREREAEELLRETLKRNWDASLMRLYSRAEGSDPAEQLAAAEGWLKQHERDPALLCTLGRLALRAQLWGKARSYLEASLGLEPDPASYRELGELLERLGEKEAAAECFRKGLARAIG